MDVSKMPLGVLASDEGDGVALFVYPMGNGDWYASIAPERDDGGLPMGDHAVRFATSGSQLGDAVLVMALLYRIATPQHDVPTPRRDLEDHQVLRRALLRGLRTRGRRSAQGCRDGGARLLA
jgi:hypothetical protein